MLVPNWTVDLREALGASAETDYLMRHLIAGEFPGNRGSQTTVDPANGTPSWVDPPEIRNIQRRACDRLRSQSDQVIMMIDQIPNSVLDLIAEFETSLPGGVTWPLDAVWSGGRQLCLRFELAQRKYGISAKELIDYLFKTDDDSRSNSYRRRQLRTGRPYYLDAEGWVHNHADFLRPFLHPSHPLVSEAWTMMQNWSQSSPHGLFLVELSVAATCSRTKLRAQLGPLARRVGVDCLGPLLFQQLELGNAATRTQALCLLRDLTPADRIPDLAASAGCLLGNDRSAAVRRELDQLSTAEAPAPRVDQRRIDLDLDIPLPPAVEAALPQDHVKWLLGDTQGRFLGTKKPDSALSVVDYLDAEDLACLSSVHIARLLIGEDHGSPTHRDRLIRALHLAGLAIPIASLEQVLPSHYTRDQRARYILRTLANLAASTIIEPTWPRAEVVDWIHEHLNEVADQVRDPKVRWRIQTLFPFLVGYKADLPDWLNNLVLETAVSGPVSMSAERRAAFGPDACSLVTPFLQDGKVRVRKAAAEWLADLGDPEALSALHVAVETEQTVQAKTAMLDALAVLKSPADFDVADHLNELTEFANARIPKKLVWLDFDAIPAIRSTDRDLLDPAAVRGWVLASVRVNSVDPSDMARQLALYLDRDDSTRLGEELLAQWLAVDQRSYTVEEATTIAKRRSVILGILGTTYRNLEDVTIEVLKKPAGTALDTKGVLSMVAALQPPSSALLVAQYIDFWDSGFRRQQCIALVRMLGWMDHEPAIDTVTRIAQTESRKSVRQAAIQAVENLATRVGWSEAEVADRTAGRGLLGEDGTFIIDGSEVKFVVDLDPNLEIRLTNQQTGHSIRRLPSEAAVQWEERERYRDSRRAIRNSVKHERQRMDQEQTTGRSYDAQHFVEVVLTHPILYRLAVMRSWIIDNGQSIKEICVEPGRITRRSGAPIEPLPNSRIRQVSVRSV